MPSIRDTLAKARTRIDATDARVLLQHVLGASHAWLLAHDDETPGEAQAARYAELVERRARGEPVAYLTGQREFYGHAFEITPAVLIPRPETELLVELALARLPENKPCSVLDLGTGSGILAITLALQRPQASVTAVDASTEALAVAQRNADRLLQATAPSPPMEKGLGESGGVRFLHSDWFSMLGAEQFSLIVSNPPYVASGDPHLGQGDLRFEPQQALASGPDGLDDIRLIVRNARAHLRPDGWLLFEHGYDQAASCRALLAEHGYTGIFSTRDLAGIERASGGKVQGAPEIAHSW
ncbi:MAG: peptide chain release factor N(5)-glutamine methyltransferase [Pseudomonadota bacterium]